ncbi:glycosyltransferase family 4 protein [Sphaerotilus sp.]|uniref:glycosyltransferase family 4 protein n=1 Tax=Sphaerotilus sp. TaxID=2093942 RepID=UPI0025E6A9FF|nr:glycosyltransferase family 4 protein [Sphaerotilus sp.]
MNILYLNHYAGAPALGMEYRPYYLAREWIRMGHRVQMVACATSHVRATAPVHRDHPVNAPTHQDIDGIDYLWFPGPAYQGNGLGRVKNIWAFLRQVWRASRSIATQFRPDVVIASSTYPMDIWVARRLARMARAKLVFEVHDLWPMSPIELSGMSPWHPFILLCQKAEDDAYRDADVVVSMLPKVHAHMASRGLDLKKLHIVPNGITLDEWTGELPALRPDVAAAVSQARVRGATVVGYAGSMGLPNALDTLLDAMRQLQAQGASIAVVMVGGGHERDRLAERVRAEGLANVQMLPPIPKAQIPSFLAEIDLAYIGWQRVPIYRFGIAPNKLMDYMMAGCAVLHSVEAGNDPVAEAGCGLTVAPESAEAVADGLKRMAALTPTERHAMGERGQAFVQAHHTYPVLARRFLAACGG